MNLEALHRTLIEKLGNDPAGLLRLLAPDAVVEFPYAAAIGMPTRYEGAAAIGRYFVEVGKRMGFSGFRFSNVRAYPLDADSAWFEMHGSAGLASWKTYEQDYVQFLRVENGLVKLYREYWNMVPILELR